MQPDLPSVPTPFAMTVVEQRIMDRIFQHPISHNLSWREVNSLFDSIGSAEQVHNGRTLLRLNGEHQNFEQPAGKDLGPNDVMSLRHLLARAGWTDGVMPKFAAQPATHDLMIVIDHQDARIYPLLGADDTRSADETKHLTHYMNTQEHDANTDESYPADTQYFDDIAAAMGDQGAIIIVSHGAGRANEGGHLLAHWDKHHKDIRARVAATLIADLPHSSTEECLELARAALETA